MLMPDIQNGGDQNTAGLAVEHNQKDPPHCKLKGFSKAGSLDESPRVSWAHLKEVIFHEFMQSPENPVLDLSCIISWVKTDQSPAFPVIPGSQHFAYYLTQKL